MLNSHVPLGGVVGGAPKPCAAGDTETREVERALRDLMLANNNVEANLASLSERLVPALRSVECSEKGSEICGSPYSTSLARVIEKEAARAWACNKSLQDLLDRLEL